MVCQLLPNADGSITLIHMAQKSNPPGTNGGLNRSRLDQIIGLAAGAIVTKVDAPDDPSAEGASLELYIKEEPKGPGYVCDFVYVDQSLPVTLCGVLLAADNGLFIGELEIFRAQLGYFNDYGDFVGDTGEWRAKNDESWDVSARPDALLRRPDFLGVNGSLLRA